MAVTALDDHDVAVGRPVQRAGRWVDGANEIVLDRSLAADLGIAVGDQVRLTAGSTAAFTVVGTAVNLTDCFYPQCDPGRAWVTTGGFDRLSPGDDAYSQVWLRFDNANEADPFVQRQAQAGVRGIGGTDSWLDTRSDFLTLDRVFGAFVTAFGLFVLVAAAVVVAGSMVARLVERRREIGLLGAVGFTPRQVSAALLLEHLALGVVAAVIGWLLAGFLAPSLQLGIGAALGTQRPAWTLLGLVVTVLVINVILTLATILPARRAARQPVTDLLRDVPGERSGRLTRRVAGLPRRLSTARRSRRGEPARPRRAHRSRHRCRGGRRRGDCWLRRRCRHGEGQIPPAAGSPYDVTVTNQSSPAQVEAALASDPNVGGWYSELWRRSTFHDGAFMAIAIGGDPDDAHFRLGGGRAMQAAGEAIAGYGFLKRFGVSVGDEVQFPCRHHTADRPHRRLVPRDGGQRRDPPVPTRDLDGGRARRRARHLPAHRRAGHLAGRAGRRAPAALAVGCPRRGDRHQRARTSTRSPSPSASSPSSSSRWPASTCSRRCSPRPGSRLAASASSRPSASHRVS